MRYAVFLIALATLPLAACGRSENAPAIDMTPAGSQPVSLMSGPAIPAPMAEPAAGGAPGPFTVVAQIPPDVPAKVEALPPARGNPLATSNPAAASPTSPVETPSAAASPDLAHGQQIYGQACAYCHDRGVAGAPKTGDAAAWNPRLAQGMDTLYAVALRGKGAMPAKGGNPALTDTSVKAAVDYLVAQSR